DGLRRGDIDAFASQALEPEPAELIRAEPADISRAPSKPRAAHHRRRDLSAGQLREPLEPVLGVAAGKAVDDREEVDAVLAKPDDVERSGGGSEKRKRDPHGRPC